MSQLITIAKRQRKERAAADDAALEAIGNAYANMYDGLEGDIDALTLAIEDLDNPTRQEVEALPQYKRLIRNAEDELEDFTIYLKTAIVAAGIAAMELGLAHSAELINLSGAGFVSVSPSVMRSLLDFLQKGGPLYERLDMITTATIESVIDAIMSGIGAGFNPRKTANLIQDAFGGGLTDALRNMRTIQIKAYQESARANYIASDGIVTGWVWYANLDGDPCMSCIVMHGSEHPLDESLDDHYNGECAALPLIPEFGNPVEQTGQSWFDGLSDSRQRELMGKGKHEAYKAGKFEFSALSNRQDHDIFGTMRTETALKDLIPGE